MGGKSKPNNLEKAIKGKIKKQKARSKKKERKQKKQVKRNIRNTEKNNLRQQTSQDIKAYRYSVAYASRMESGGKAFRAEVITLNPQNKDRIKAQLVSALDNRVNTLNSGLRRMYNNSIYLGLEAEEIGGNDVAYRTQLNRIYITIE